MRQFIIPILVLVFITFSCQAQKKSNVKSEETAITFVVDCTDQALFKEINQDFHDNLSVFFKQLGVGNIDWYEKLTVRMCAIDDTDQLGLRSASIALKDKSISRREEGQRRNPKPLLQLISTSLSNYESLCQRDMKSSPIINVMLKVFREMNPEATREVVVLCTDGVELSGYGNLYKDIPATDAAVAKLVGKIDGILFNEAKARIEEVDPQVVFVLKSNAKVNISSLKLFYSKLMTAFGISSYCFIDNFTNNPNFN